MNVIHDTICPQRMILFPAILKVVSVAYRRKPLFIASLIVTSHLRSEQRLNTKRYCLRFIGRTHNALNEIPKLGRHRRGNAQHTLPLINCHLSSTSAIFGLIQPTLSSSCTAYQPLSAVDTWGSFAPLFATVMMS